MKCNFLNLCDITYFFIYLADLSDHSFLFFSVSCNLCHGNASELNDLSQVFVPPLHLLHNKKEI